MTREVARAVIDSCGGDLNLAMLQILSQTQLASPVDQLRDLGGLTHEAAASYLAKASGDLEVARNMVLQGAILIKFQHAPIY